MSKDASIGWMYEGEKGNVHREDYLMGKKVDKNFEKYSDVVNAQKAEAIDTIVSKRTVYGGASSSGLKTSSLQKDIIKSEDPFVAVKVREETKRREIMDNPLMKVRLQNMLKSMMTSSKSEKKKEKKSKKEKKKKKKRSRSSSASSRDSSVERSKKERKRERSPSPKRRRRTSERSEEPKRRDRSRSAERIIRRSRTPKRQRSRSRSRSRSVERRDRRKSKSPRRRRSAERRHQSPKRSREIKRKNSRSRSRSRSADSDKQPSSSQSKSTRRFDAHIPTHLRNKDRRSSDSDSDSDSERPRDRDSDGEKAEKKSYGLVEMRKRTADERAEDARAPSKEYKLVKIPTGRGGNDNKKQREPRRVLTDEEKAARLAAMQQDNVHWRDDVRAKNVARGRVEDEEEKVEADKNGYAPSFIRSQMRAACDDLTVEKRLQSRKGGVQRSHGYMDRSFARK